MEGAGIYAPAPNGRRYFCTPGVIAGSDYLVFFFCTSRQGASPLSSGRGFVVVCFGFPAGFVSLG